MGKEGEEKAGAASASTHSGLSLLTVEDRREMCTNRIEQRREVPEPDGMYFFPFFFLGGEKLKGESVEGIC
jgi:hypothetical protein